MRTRSPSTRPSRRNQHLARLDARIKRRGETMEIQHKVGSSTQTQARVNLRGIVKTFGVQQLIGGLTQTNYMLIISPTDMRRAKWPGPGGDFNLTKPTGHTPTKDTTIPLIGDWVLFRGRTTSISGVDAIYDGDECIRIEMKVIG